MKELLLARDTALFPLDSDISAAFRHVHYIVSSNKAEQTRIESIKIEKVRSKLEEGLEEWRAIARYVETLKGWREGDKYKLWLAVLEEIVPERRLNTQIEEISKCLLVAADMLT